ncbi:hypothetical protein [Staphylococcus xylosus]|uniref:hypothetical protein n=1 Tax=Staphylococcus xylosus TaxID=1288 RepID=UPI003F5668DC
MSKLTIEIPKTLNNRSLSQSVLINIILPEQCPYCDQIQSPKYISSSGIEENSNRFSIILECNKCSQYFLQSYGLSNSSSFTMGRTTYNGNRLNPSYQYDNETLSTEITSCSENFANIHKQLQMAEKHNLSELLKLGYRKAIEQLVWDYLIKYEDKTENNLQRKSFPDRIKLLKLPESEWLSDLIAWIGNDGAHPYVRHEKLTAEDMKILSNMLIDNIHLLIQQHKYKNYHSVNK